MEGVCLVCQNHMRVSEAWSMQEKRDRQDTTTKLSPMLTGALWTSGQEEGVSFFFSFSDYHVSLRIKKANAIIAILVLCFVFIK